jgi:uncharacterized protein (DUF1501 family)
MNKPLSKAGRREFLRQAAHLSIAGVAAPWALNLAALAEAAAQSVSDYKALVCVFLYGGNDHGNTLVPADAATHAQYTQIRGSLATPLDKLGSTLLTPSVPLPDGRQLALAPELAPLMPLFAGGQLAVLLNVGTLIQPTSREQFRAANVPLPPKLFSHNDQQSVWQSSLPEGATSGWGGRMGDLFLSSNNKATFTCVNVAGNAVFMSGTTAVQYQVSPGGSVPLRGLQQPLFGSAACSEALRHLVTAPHTHLMRSEYTRITNRAIDADATLTASLGPPDTRFDLANPLQAQLQMVARMIAAREALGAKRQVFFVSLGGFDNHDFLLSQHPGLLTTVGTALATFYEAIAAMGVQNQVTTFSASDFGRTLTSNGDGSDHGWGSHHFVMGGAVSGGRFHGALPAYGLDNDNAVGQGRLLPSTSVDQLAATLALWMGVSSTDLALVAPNIGNWRGQENLGLFRA